MLRVLLATVLCCLLCLNSLLHHVYSKSALSKARDLSASQLFAKLYNRYAFRNLNWFGPEFRLIKMKAIELCVLINR